MLTAKRGESSNSLMQIYAQERIAEELLEISRQLEQCRVSLAFFLIHKSKPYKK